MQVPFAFTTMVEGEGNNGDSIVGFTVYRLPKAVKQRVYICISISAK